MKIRDKQALVDTLNLLQQAMEKINKAIELDSEELNLENSDLYSRIRIIFEDVYDIIPENKSTF
jgi:hypothetical protein